MPPWWMSSCNTLPQTRKATAVPSAHASMETIKVRRSAARWLSTDIWLSSIDAVRVTGRAGRSVDTGRASSRTRHGRVRTKRLRSGAGRSRAGIFVRHLGLQILGGPLESLDRLADGGAQLRQLAGAEDDEKNDQTEDEPDVATVDERHGLNLSLGIGNRRGFHHQSVAVCEVLGPEIPGTGDEG